MNAKTSMAMLMRGSIVVGYLTCSQLLPWVFV